MNNFKKEKTVGEVTTDAFHKFEMQSIQVGECYYDVWVDVYDIADTPKIEKYIKNNLPAEDRDKYNREIFALEETQQLKPK
ncbi:hypothetical protein [Pseudogracilibacillus auburnensis]|uniref:hypothetical protein n=1 Tax=Pseudogracilibacillus auburnensis TaxID=1494959 RepID=UPI001A975E9C|nr:hypothetical protein [Pseudogracilibacillus auburnensis]MBO1001252.1 hypothetical protein [Pseudogracilibacillus auburnensis]